MLSYFKARSRLFSNSAFSYACIMTICNAVVVGIAYISISWHLLSLRNSIEVIMLFMFTWYICGFIITTYRLVMLIGSLLATLCSFKIIPKRNVKNTKISFLRNWQEVISFLNQNKTLYWCYLAQIGMTCLYMIAPVFIFPYAKNILKASSLEFGLIEVTFSVGFIVGNVLLPYMIEKISPKQTLVFSMTISALMYLLLGLNESIFFASIYYLVAGIFISAWVIIVTIAQKNTPITLQGKIQGICYGFSGLVVMFIYLIFFAINYIHYLVINGSTSWQC
ncbi:MFS transporter [Francisella tularensis]|nr:MFS transporter [Francisella tularensis]MBK2149644.1 MFS transporter [Francisella tularensis]MBK2250777.1 MFS transporter [Francisella tularensis]NDS80417.1 MFS transporter [Francisella tularensis subsp. holarctica]NDT60367.1 MFS transporter [Francisella tularensis subsp. holarctica]UZW94605.1 MFS transporter [Francisella tularensis subsp. holarctica]